MHPTAVHTDVDRRKKKRQKASRQPGAILVGNLKLHQDLKAKLESLKQGKAKKAVKHKQESFLEVDCDMDFQIADVDEIEEVHPKPSAALVQSKEVCHKTGATPFTPQKIESAPTTKTTGVDNVDIRYEERSKPSDRASQSKARAHQQYEAWKELLPKLVKPHLAHMTSMAGVAVKPSDNLNVVCPTGGCSIKTHKIFCLYLDHCRTITATSCNCITAAEQLVGNGLFPCGPNSPKLAVSTVLLEFYRALFEQSCDAITSMAAAMYNFYQRRGFPLTDKNGGRLQDPFRRGLTVAVQWYDALRVQIDREVDDAIGSKIPTPISKRSFEGVSPGSMEQKSSTSTTDAKPQLTPGQAARWLRNRCPACFGHKEWGRPLESGGDVHVSVDGNFHHRHQATAGDGPEAALPTWLIPKAQVDEVGRLIEEARKKKPKNYKRKVPDVAIKGCEESYEAAEGDKKKATSDKFDDHGLMFLVCRHDIPLFFVNIDTPGEQQKFPVALLLQLISLLPPQATISQLYDIACVLHRSVQLYGLFPDDVARRLRFATSVMHAYGHQWACQLNYNPRMLDGMGLSDGEGVERLWSRLRKLIGIERSQWRSKRLWLIDRQATAIALELRSDLGLWLDRRLTLGVQDQGTHADDEVTISGIEESVLQDEWRKQIKAQSSKKAHAPARLKKGVDKVLSILGDLESVEKSITNMKAEVSKTPKQDPEVEGSDEEGSEEEGSDEESAKEESTKEEDNGIQEPEEEDSKSSLEILKELKAVHNSLTAKVDELYTSMNLPESFPELKNVNLGFVKTLVLARDLKVNIRKRAIGSFFEWDKLGQAAGGKGQTLGTKLHQQTRTAMSKRTPALVSAVRKFNKYCDKLAELRKPGEEEIIPLPSHLPTKLIELRRDPSLMEDVWTSSIDMSDARWLVDAKVRTGIRSMLRKQRCQEESLRLALEARNLVTWYEQELRGIEGALKDPAYIHFRSILLQRHNEHLQLPATWKSDILPLRCFATHNPLAIGQLEYSSAVPSVDFTVEMLGDIEDPSQEVAQPTPLDPDEAILGDLLDADSEVDSVVEAQLPLKQADSEPQVRLRENNTSSELIASNATICFEGVNFINSDITRLKSPTARLNDVCVNGCAKLLHAISLSSPTSMQTARHCAILSTWDLPRIRRSCPDDRLWDKARGSHFWERDVWILPIHRPKEEHWICCGIYPQKRRILLFDSLGYSYYDDDIQDAIVLVKRLLRLAQSKGYTIDDSALSGEWSVQLPVSHRLQSNGYDCGVWVLVFIDSLLRGYNALKTEETDIVTFRGRLVDALLSTVNTGVVSERTP